MRGTLREEMKGALREDVRGALRQEVRGNFVEPYKARPPLRSSESAE